MDCGGDVCFIARLGGGGYYGPYQTRAAAWQGVDSLADGQILFSPRGL